MPSWRKTAFLAVLAIAVTTLAASAAGTPGTQGGAAVRIAFNSDREGSLQVFVMGAGGADQRRVTSGPNSSEPWSWSPDGTLIAFETSRTGSVDIYTVNPDTLEETQITSEPSQDSLPVFSPDGSRIAFVTDRAGPPNTYGIWIMDADGSDAYDTGVASGNPVTWSPDGSRLAYNPSGTSYIGLMNPNGTGQTQLTPGPGVRIPAWSPDGSKIAFESFRDGNRDIYVIDADGDNETRLTTDPAEDGDPTWLGGGSQIAFVSERDGNQEIYVMDAGGQTETRLTFSAGADRRPTGTVVYSAPPAGTPTAPPHHPAASGATSTALAGSP
ncbi:MAG: hypothetical protein Q7T33_00150 [Dehalococcoidia bacterium]|nr:hypothetical protein [Dehalococcoidia bacterium]